MTYTVDEAREIAEVVKPGGRVLQVGSQYTSMDHFWKAKKAINDGLLGDVVWASGGFGRNEPARRVELRDRSRRDREDARLEGVSRPGAKAFVRSGALLPLAQVLGLFGRHCHRSLLPLGVAAARCRLAASSPLRVTSSGGIYLQKDREVPDTFFMNVDYPAWTMQLACSVGSGVGAPLVVHGSQATLFIGQNSENLINTEMEVVPDQEYSRRVREEDRRRDVEGRRRSRWRAARTRTWTTSSHACVHARSPTCRRSSDIRRWPQSAWACRPIARVRCCSSIGGKNESRTSCQSEFPGSLASP